MGVLGSREVSGERDDSVEVVSTPDLSESVDSELLDDEFVARVEVVLVDFDLQVEVLLIVVGVDVDLLDAGGILSHAGVLHVVEVLESHEFSLGGVVDGALAGELFGFKGDGEVDGGAEVPGPGNAVDILVGDKRAFDETGVDDVGEAVLDGVGLGSLVDCAVVVVEPDGALGDVEGEVGGLEVGGLFGEDGVEDERGAEEELLVVGEGLLVVRVEEEERVDDGAHARAQGGVVLRKELRVVEPQQRVPELDVVPRRLQHIRELRLERPRLLSPLPDHVVVPHERVHCSQLEPSCAQLRSGVLQKPAHVVPDKRNPEYVQVKQREN